MWFYLLLAVVIVAVAVLLLRQNQSRQRIEREREERRARTDELLARVLLGEEPARGRKTASGRTQSMAKPLAPPAQRMVKPAAGGQQIDIDILLGDEPDSVAERARRQLARPTNFAPDMGNSSAAAGTTTTMSSPSPLSLSDGQLDVPLDALVVAWFEARGYVTRPAPDSARPISLLLAHRDDSSRSYAFFFDRGRLHAQRAASLLEQARQLGMSKLLVAAEHGADPAVGSTRLRDVQVMDWIAIDREMKKLDFRVAAKIIAIARASRGMPAAD
ncbi:MAG: hypothetical protein OEY27_08395 [Gammaproteobacteria bacterium]|nr:hypothetical protein [Gammaproteobacteria bacterium]